MREVSTVRKVFADVTNSRICLTSARKEGRFTGRNVGISRLGPHPKNSYDKSRYFFSGEAFCPPSLLVIHYINSFALLPGADPYADHGEKF